MADGGVWARLPQPNNGGGIWTKTSSGWVEIGGGGGSDGLEGLGGWAEITEVSGSPKRYAYNDGGTDWVAFKWAGDGSVKTTEGLVDTLLVSGGNGAKGGGNVTEGLHSLTATTHTITVSVGVSESLGSASSSLSAIISGAGRVYGGAGAINGGNMTATANLIPRDNSITGTTVGYGGIGAAPVPNTGWGQSAGTGDGGCVIVRVPADQAAGVDPGSWVTRIDYYAEVTDGIVTDLYQERFYGDDTVRTENGQYASPEQPDDLIPCDPTVAEGWTYADGEFTPPPPDPSWREEAIKALKEQLKDLQKDT